MQEMYVHAQKPTCDSFSFIFIHEVKIVNMHSDYLYSF